MLIRVIKQPIEEIAQHLAASLTAGVKDVPKLALFLSGGSAVTIYSHLIPLIDSRKMGTLVLALVDERFSTDIENQHSNFYQIDTNTNLFTRAREHYHDIIPILEGSSLEETVTLYNRRLTNLWANGFTKIAILGLGPDGHTAGILPNPDKNIFDTTFRTQDLVVGYTNQGQYPHRITLTPKALQDMDRIFVFASGYEKTQALRKVVDISDQPMHVTPARLLNQLQKVELFTDQEL